MALKRKLQIVLDSVAPEIHNLWLRPVDDLRWELNFFNGSVWRPLDFSNYLHGQIVDGTNPHQTTFANLVNKPTTISGYGITDSLVYTNDSRLSDARNAWCVYLSQSRK